MFGYYLLDYILEITKFCIILNIGFEMPFTKKRLSYIVDGILLVGFVTFMTFFQERMNPLVPYVIVFGVYLPYL